MALPPLEEGVLLSQKVLRAEDGWGETGSVRFGGSTCGLTPFPSHSLLAQCLIASYVLYVCNRPTVSRISDRAKCM